MIKTINGKLQRLKNNIDLSMILKENVDFNKENILLAGTNFGVDSNIKDFDKDLIIDKIQALIVSSINRRVFRYLINIGIPVIISPEAYNQFRGGEKVEINLSEGKIISKKTTVNFTPFSEELLGIIKAGGLIPYTKMNINR